jgi:hypothetical protein
MRTWLASGADHVPLIEHHRGPKLIADGSQLGRFRCNATEKDGSSFSVALQRRRPKRRKREGSKPRCPSKSLKHPLTPKLRTVTTRCIYTLFSEERSRWRWETWQRCDSVPVPLFDAQIGLSHSSKTRPLRPVVCILRSLRCSRPLHRQHGS